MGYRSLESSKNQNYCYILNIAHLYGNLMNTYGDNGNILMFKYVAEKLRTKIKVDIVSLNDDLIPDNYDFIFFGGGQDFEQSVVSKDLQNKREGLTQFIEQNGIVLAICGGFQLLGQYYIESSGQRIDGIGIMDHYTLNQPNNRYIGNIKIYNEEFNEVYYGFENHQGCTFLSRNEKPLGKVIYGNGNNAQDKSEGAHYKNVFCSYLHGPLLSRNSNLTYRLVTTALKNKYKHNVELEKYEDLFSLEILEERDNIREQKN